MSFWIWMSGRKRKDLLKFFIVHVAEVEKVVEKSKNVVDELVKGNADLVAVFWGEVFESERKADDIKRKLLAELASETFHPIDREEIVRLILTMDDVAAYAKAWSRRAMLYLPDRLPQNIGNALVTMASRVHEAVKYIKQAVEMLPENPRGTLELANKVESLEEEVDDIRHEVFREVLKFCDSSRSSKCMLTKEIMDSIENAADRCEDVADVLRSIALLSI
ncbi:MAG: DUF47 family protein [Sulfolobales archaeon]